MLAGACPTVQWHCQHVLGHSCRLRDEHTLRGTAEAELCSMRAQVAALKQKVQAAVAEQGRAAQLALDLEGERRQHSEARHQLSSAESRWGCPVDQVSMLSLPVWQSQQLPSSAESGWGRRPQCLVVGSCHLEAHQESSCGLTVQDAFLCPMSHATDQQRTDQGWGHALCQ